MALRDQPYLPLYVMDFLTDEKLNECSAESTGVYIRLMCVMHKSETYGVINLLPRDIKSDSNRKNFAIKLSKHMPFDIDTIERALDELLELKILTLDDDVLYQKRMVRDNEISQAKAKSGKKGASNRYGEDCEEYKEEKKPKRSRKKTVSKENLFVEPLLQDDIPEICHSTDTDEKEELCHSTNPKNNEENLIANYEYEIEYENEAEVEDVNEVEEVEQQDNVLERFEAFWQAYPRKKGKGGARKAFLKIAPSNELLNQMILALEAAKKSSQWQKNKGEFIPYPATWLNQTRWEDEVDVVDRSVADNPEWDEENPYAIWKER